MTTANGCTGCLTQCPIVGPKKHQMSVLLQEMQYENRSWALDVLECPRCQGRIANPCSDSFTGCDRKNSRLPRPALPCSPNFVGCARIHGSSRSVFKSA